MNEKDIQKIIQNRIPVLFLDYDGILTPIVKRPEDALIFRPDETTMNKIYFILHSFISPKLMFLYV